MTTLLTAIVYCNTPDGEKFLKFRNISDSDQAKDKFLLFAAKFDGAQYVNWYKKQNKKFIERIYLR